LGEVVGRKVKVLTAQKGDKCPQIRSVVFESVGRNSLGNKEFFVTTYKFLSVIHTVMTVMLENYMKYCKCIVVIVLNSFEIHTIRPSI